MSNDVKKPPKPLIRNPTTILIRQRGVSQLTDLALSILGEQLDKLALKSKHSTFDEKEAKIVTMYVKAVREMSQETREQEKSDKDMEGLAELSNEELLQIASKHLEKESKSGD
jgi:hypothetical protein